jgi:hypothetical protein
MERFEHQDWFSVLPVGEQVSRAIEDFEPRIPPAEWETYKVFVRQAVADAEAMTPYDARHMMSVVTRLVRWTHRVAGHPLDRNIVFCQDVIEEFVVTQFRRSSTGYQANIRSSLFSIGRALLGDQAFPRRMRPLPHSEPLRPYSRPNQIELRYWADGQSTPSRRHDANVLLVCCLGAGLKSQDFKMLRSRDVLVDDDGYVLRVPTKRSRFVPVLAEWEDRLPELVARVGAGDHFLFRPERKVHDRNVVGNFIDRTSTNEVRPSLQRMRTTWIVHHLTSGTPIVALMEAAGVSSLEAFTRFLCFVPPCGSDEARRALRGGSS